MSLAEGFVFHREEDVSLDQIEDKGSAALVTYWNSKRGAKSFAYRDDLDPVDIPELLGHVRLVDIEAGGVFRFRVYGTSATNPDQRDMTGKTTQEYQDKAFGDLVTAHYRAVAESGEVRCWRVLGQLGTKSYAHLRVVLPVSRNREFVDSLLISSSLVK